MTQRLARAVEAPEEREMKMTTSIVRASAGILLFSAAGACYAGTTPVRTRQGEPDQKTIIQHLYGRPFLGTPATGFVADLSRGGSPMTLARVSDYGHSAILDAAGSNTSSADDKVWQNGIVSASAHARFAGYSQKFGYFPGTSAGASYVNLFNVGGNGYGVTGEVHDLDMGSLFTSWRWARAGTGSTFSSRPSDNPDRKDHMVTYKVEGLHNGFDASWLLFFEDLRSNQSSDWDYNDLVVQLDVNVRTIPLPGAGLMGGAGLIGVAALRRRRPIG